MKSPKLDPTVRAILEAMEATGRPPLEQLPIEQARASREGMIALTGDPEPVAHVENREIPGKAGSDKAGSEKAGSIRVRIYTPDESAGPHPAMVYFHGGGWVICDLDTHDNTCRSIARRSGAVVVSVEYRLAPENKFPAAVDDCESATRWVAANAAELNIDPSRIAVSGDSAGGNLAAVVARRLRDSGRPALALQVLIYPVTDLRVSDTPSMREFGKDNLLERSALEWFSGLYLNNRSEATNPDASPLLAQDLSNLPPALVQTAECDPLCSEGEDYASRLKQAGVPVTYTCYPGMIHAFVAMPAVLPAAITAIDEIAAAIKQMHTVAAASHA
jgi:acetyl esterase